MTSTFWKYGHTERYYKKLEARGENVRRIKGADWVSWQSGKDFFGDCAKVYSKMLLALSIYVGVGIVVGEYVIPWYNQDVKPTINQIINITPKDLLEDKLE